MRGRQLWLLSPLMTLAIAFVNLFRFIIVSIMNSAVFVISVHTPTKLRHGCIV